VHVSTVDVYVVFRFNGKGPSESMSIPPVITITGASSGIGEASARLFARNGYRVALAARRQERLETLAGEIRREGGEALPIPTDVSQLDSIQNLVQVTLEKYGQIDVLFNNAGFGRLDWLEKLDPEEDIQAMVQVNLLGLIQTTRAVLPHMMDRRCGHIINMCSIAGLVSTPTYSVYSATKFAIRGFTDALRREVGMRGIRVSGIYPGAVDTEFSLHTRSQRKTGIGTPVWLRLSSEQVAQRVYILCHHPQRMVVMPWPMIPAIWLTIIFPGFSDKIVERVFVRRERIGS